MPVPLCLLTENNNDSERHITKGPENFEDRKKNAEVQRRRGAEKKNDIHIISERLKKF